MFQDRDTSYSDDQKDLELLEAIRNKQTDAWENFIAKYQTRLMNFALSKLHQQADAEDVLQETFISFIRGLDNYRCEGPLENYLFAILRNNIIKRYRSKEAGFVSLIQDVYYSQSQQNRDPSLQIPATDSLENWMVSQSEQRHLQQEVLAKALLKLCNNFRKSLKFRNLKLLELLLYCRVSTATTAELLKMEESVVRVFKHRCVKRLREDVKSLNTANDLSFEHFENLLTETWESQRLTCPKRSTLGAFLMEQLEPDWFDYIDFHLTTLGCHFCRANLKDLRQQRTRQEQLFLDKIMASTVGFFRNTNIF